MFQPALPCTPPPLLLLLGLGSVETNTEGLFTTRVHAPPVLTCTRKEKYMKSASAAPAWGVLVQIGTFNTHACTCIQ